MASASGRPVPAHASSSYRPADAGGAQPGELVVAERIGARALGPDRARVLERLGQAGDPRSISLLAAHGQDLRIAFPPEVERVTVADLPAWSLAGRDDLRGLPLVTIDGEDARDFDDAVSPSPTAIRPIPAAGRPGRHRRRCALCPAGRRARPRGRQRGNSVYFPDRVVPMLPEALSNGCARSARTTSAPAWRSGCGSTATAGSCATASCAP